ncbi:MAG: hypothetical protein KatS3mg081_0276 [Gemmatimonadales bacterium]|nr:MAG: hypothetical protein KatS3mg081_0276 [Gemmatimonadales bacterium]
MPSDLAALIDNGLADIETAGALRGGRVWMLVRFKLTDPAVSEVFAEEVVPYGLLSNNHARGRVTCVLHQMVITCRSMRRATVTIPDDIAPALEAYLADQRPVPSLTSVVHDALAAFLAERGYLPGAAKRLKLTPARRGSGTRSTSTDHDAVLAG